MKNRHYYFRKRALLLNKIFYLLNHISEKGVIKLQLVKTATINGVPTARYISFIMIALMGNIFFDPSYIVVFALLVLHPLVLLINLFLYNRDKRVKRKNLKQSGTIIK